MHIQYGYDAAAYRFLHDALYADIHDKQKHLGTMCAIADELALPLEEVAERYETVLAHLKTQARIPDYLPVLVSKRVKQFYRQH